MFCRPIGHLQIALGIPSTHVDCTGNRPGLLHYPQNYLQIVKSLYSEAEKIAHRAVKTNGERRYDLDQRIDRLVTSPITGLPIMLILLAR
jgi:Fe2+ transport system protein B